MFLHILLTLPASVSAQCGFPATITAGRAFCTTTPMWVSSTHGLQHIDWYQGNKLVKTAIASQSLSTTGTIAVAWTGAGGTEPIQIVPIAVFIDEHNNLFVSDREHNVVKKYPPGGGAGVVVAGANGQGTNLDQLEGPESIFVDLQDNLYVYDVGNNCIKKFAPGATMGVIVGLLPGGDNRGLYVDCAGNIYAPVVGQQSVLKFTPGSTTGKVVAGGNGEGFAANQFIEPIGMWVDQQGDIFVCDIQKSTRIMEWKPGATTGILVAGGNGDGPNHNQVGGLLWMDGKNNMYLSDDAPGNFNSRVDIWPLGASGSTTLLTSNSAGTAHDRFGAADLKEDPQGNVFIADFSNNRVLEFKRNSYIDSTYTPTDPGQYYAVVTDMRGYTDTTDPITVIIPSGPPSTISITATATNTPVCTPITFTATAANAGPNPNFRWVISGVTVGSDTPAYTNNLFANGDQVYCILTSSTSCSIGIGGDTSNIIALGIDSKGAATVTIAASDTAICQGSTVVFDATVTNGSAQPGFQWLINGVVIPGDDSASYHSDSLANGNVITCLITSDDACGLAKSNSIPIIVSIPPVIAAGQVFTIPYGKSITLDPAVTGNVTSWLWTPGTGLSDSTIEDPVAAPFTTTLYTLKATAPGCPADSATVLVNVYTPISLPNAFTPNGDGHNDVFYVLSGPVNSRVDLAVFNRWGQAVFRAHDATPGDRSKGWNGYIHGQPAEPGTYVYIVDMKFADDSSKTYKGTVMLIR